jgi:hypothetical protein
MAGSIFVEQARDKRSVPEVGMVKAGTRKGDSTPRPGLGQQIPQE